MVGFYPDNKVVHQTLDNTEMHAVASELQADNIINETADITFQAGTSITLKAGFHAKAGTNFVAKIADCPQSGFKTDGFVERSSDSYLYDANGNMTREPNKRISILYNYWNQPYKITFDNGNTIEWLYSGDNVKLQKVTRINGLTLLKQDYFGGIEFRNDTLEALYFDVGRLFFEGGSAHYEYSMGDPMA
ncbi:MAG: 3-coathanger stack domain-containing protein [Bacteroidota bacterium]